MKLNLKTITFIALAALVLIGGGYYRSNKESSKETNTLEKEIEKQREKSSENSISQKKYNVLVLCQKHNYTSSNCEKDVPSEIKDAAYKELALTEDWEIRYLCHCETEEVSESYKDSGGNLSDSERDFVQFKHLYKTYLQESGVTKEEIKVKLDELERLYQEDKNAYKRLKQEIENQFQ